MIYIQNSMSNQYFGARGGEGRESRARGTLNRAIEECDRMRRNTYSYHQQEENKAQQPEQTSPPSSLLISVGT